MKLKTAIHIIETSYGSFGFIALIGIGISFFTLKGGTLIITIALLLTLIIVAFFIKLNLINIYLKKCKYPFEFLSVLEQLELTKDIQINWSEDLINGPQRSQLLTQQFLDDNNLATEIGAKKINLPFALIMIGIAVIGLIYFSQNISFKGKPIIFISLTILLISSIYLRVKEKKQLNDNEPILLFKDKGLLLNDTLYRWEKIKSWTHKNRGASEHSEGEIIIIYESQNNESEKIKADLNKINIDRIDFMLLLTHFKAKYS